MRPAAALSFILAVLFARTAAAQFTLEGTVVDPSRTPVEGAEVSALGEASGVTVATRSGHDGTFVLVLAPDTYAVNVVSPGLTPSSQRVTALREGSEAREMLQERVEPPRPKPVRAKSRRGRGRS